MASQFRNLVFEGGGIKGIAYIGAMQVLDRRGHLREIKRVGGTSAGAINALIYALGYSLYEQQEIMASTSFNKFMDNSFGFVRDFRRLWKEFGWNKGDFFYDWVGGLVEQKLGKRDATFADLKAAGLPDLYVVGTNLSTGYAEFFSHERHPDMTLIEAVRISMSIPLFFAARRYGSRQDVYVDGGVILNYPVKLFDRLRYVDLDMESGAVRRTDYYETENNVFLKKQPNSSPYIYNRQTLGLRLDETEEIGLFRHGEPILGKEIKTFPKYAVALVGALMQVQENMHLHSDDWHRTLYIDTLDVGTTDFDLSDEKKADLIEQGVIGGENYFQWFDDAAESPANRIQ